MAARRYEISLRVLKNIFQHEKRNFVSLSDHVIFFLLYKILTIQQKMLYSLFQKLRFEIEYISLQSVVICINRKPGRVITIQSKT